MATIQYADVDKTELLPIDAQDVVSKARLVVAGSPAGMVPWSRVTYQYDNASTWSTREFIWRPVTFEAEHDDHDELAAARSFELKGGTNHFLAPTALPFEPTAVGGMSNPGDPSAVRDGDPVTYGGMSDVTSDSSASLVYEHDGSPAANENLIYGWRLVYQLNLNSGSRTNHLGLGTPALVMMIMSNQPTSRAPDGTDTYPVYRSVYQWAIAETPAGEMRELTALASFDARVAEENNGVPPTLYTRLLFQFLGQPVGGELKVFEFYPLMLNEAELANIAASNYRLPAEKPQRVTVRGYVAPDREHTIVGWPGGDYTATVAQHQYELGRTIIDFEQAGSPVGLDADAIEAARFQDARVASAIASAGYSLKMGERQ